MSGILTRYWSSSYGSQPSLNTPCASSGAICNTYLLAVVELLSMHMHVLCAYNHACAMESRESALAALPGSPGKASCSSWQKLVSAPSVLREPGGRMQSAARATAFGLLLSLCMPACSGKPGLTVVLGGQACRTACALTSIPCSGGRSPARAAMHFASRYWRPASCRI